MVWPVLSLSEAGDDGEYFRWRSFLHTDDWRAKTCPEKITNKVMEQAMTLLF